MTEDEMVGWHHRLDGHEFEEAPRVGDRQGSLACCSPWGYKEGTRLSDWTEVKEESVQHGVKINSSWLQFKVKYLFQNVEFH